MVPLLLFIVLLSAAQISLGQSSDPATYCGADTVLDGSANQCVCTSSALEDDASRIYLAGLMDTTSYSWCPDIFEFTVEQINQGRWTALLNPATQTLEYSLRNSNCDESTAVREYWDLRKQNGNRPMHGIIGARCSGASTSLARISGESVNLYGSRSRRACVETCFNLMLSVFFKSTGLENVPQLSPASDSAKLTSYEFPFFSRLVAPNDERGEVGALIALVSFFSTAVPP